MRIHLMLAMSLLSASLCGLPVVQSVINYNIYHASSSETRCVTGYPAASSQGPTLNNLTLWNVEDPTNPIGGTTISEEQWSGWVNYRCPTVYQNLLLYMDEFYLRIIDIQNIYAPVQRYQIPLQQAYCYTIMDHYLVMGSQEGALVTYDLSNPANPQCVSTTASLPAIWMMWPCGNLLAVRCGNYSQNTAKLYEFSSGTLTEVASVTATEQLKCVGAWNGMLVLQSQAGNIRLYNYGPGAEPSLAADIPSSAETETILTDGQHLVSMSLDNCVRIWQYNGQDGLSQAGFFDLSHLQMRSGSLLELKNSRLLFTIDRYLCLRLDISDLHPESACEATYADGIEYSSIAIPPNGHTIYCEKNNALTSFKLDFGGQIHPDSEIPGTGAVKDLENYHDNLYYLSMQDSTFCLKGLNIANPANPLSFLNLPVGSDNFFSIKGNTLYSGSFSHIEKYQLDNAAIPVWQKQLSYVEPDWGYQVYFYDMVSAIEGDYAVGMFGDPFSGYFPIFVYWLPDGSTGNVHLGRFYDKVEVFGDYLYLLGWGLQVYQISTVRIPQYVSSFYGNSLNYGVQSSLLLQNRYLAMNYQLSNNICVYDLQNPRLPLLLDTICQSSTSYELGVIGNKLISASGTYGLKAYNLSNVVSNADEYIPAVQQLTAYPNPFSASVTLQFKLDKPETAKIQCYNIRGQLVYTHSLDNTKAGTNTFIWDGRDQNGRPCASGVYIVKLATSKGSAVRKITRIAGH